MSNVQPTGSRGKYIWAPFSYFDLCTKIPQTRTFERDDT